MTKMAAMPIYGKNPSNIFFSETNRRNWQMDRILIILKKENGSRASSAPALGLNTIIFTHVYWYMQPSEVEYVAIKHWYMQPSEVEYVAIKTVPDWKTSVTVLKSIHKHGRKHHAEQCWCQNTALFDPICYFKWFRELSIILHMCLHAIMKLPHHSYESGWTAKLGHDFPESITTNSVMQRAMDQVSQSCDNYDLTISQSAQKRQRLYTNQPPENHIMNQPSL